MRARTLCLHSQRESVLGLDLHAHLPISDTSPLAPDCLTASCWLWSLAWDSASLATGGWRVACSQSLWLPGME